MKTKQESDLNSTSLHQHFQTLVEIVAKLRGPQGCPWDQEQTQKSLTQYALEEAHELCEAIESGQQQEIKEELGDFLFQVILQAQVAQDDGHFDLAAVIQQLNEKMIRRHPHVFGNGKAKNSEEVWKNWEKIKAMEKASRPNKEKPIFNYPRTLPALQASYKIGVKTEGYKFDWPNANGVLDKVKEELLEVEEAFADFTAQGGLSKPVTQELPAHPVQEKLSEELKALRHEIGDLLFSTAQLARHLYLEPEQCLREANRRFETRFNAVLKLAAKIHGPEFSDKDIFASGLTLEQKESLWEQVKVTNPSSTADETLNT